MFDLSQMVAGFPRFAALAVAAVVGAATAFWFGLPAPFLTGPAALVSILAVSGLPMSIPNQLRNICFLLIGVGMGTGLSPAVVEAAMQWPLPIAVLCAGLVAITYSGAAALRRWFGFTPISALLGSTPGHLSFVIAIIEDQKGDVAQVATVQSLRVLYLTLLVPFAVQAITGGDLTALPQANSVMPIPVLVTVPAAGAIVGAFLLRLKVPAALLMGGMAVSGLAHGAGIVEGVMPNWLTVAAFTTMGALIGTRFVGVTLLQIRTAMVASLVLATLALAVTVAGMELVHGITGLPRIDLLIAFAPGGLETMAALSLMLGADPAFVAVHHLLRLLFLSLFVPLALVRIRD